MKNLVTRIAGIAGLCIGSIIVIVAIFFGVLTIAEYRPAEVENLQIQYHSGSVPQLSDATAAEQPVMASPVPGVPFRILTWNIGYASLDKSQDFFMDGGKGVRPPTNENVRENLAGIRDFITGADCDVTIIQEADINSHRSYNIDQRAYLTENFTGTSVFAANFRCIYVPIPINEPIGRVYSGILTLNHFRTSDAVRMSLPVPFKWPVRIANMKRCMLVSRIPVAGSNGAELVLANLHLEAYDSTGGREAQTKVLLDFLTSEYAKGNYCIAGGDFNQNFPGIDPERFALKNSSYWAAGTLDPTMLAPGWRYVTDTETPSNRLNNVPYSGDPETSQYYIIDGFILSPNVELIDVQTKDLGFAYSDHNPVEMTVSLK
ncbi:MAG: endonuclease/exonuclease/phosphatase family protein [Treponema sp.]|nr:endonuclease/exonuclease/phosphatase family protein [Treponema sp.]